MITFINSATMISPLSPATAYARLTEERCRLRERELLTIHVNIPRAVGTVLGAIDVLRPLQPRLMQVFGGRDPHSLEKLERYALALFHAHLVWSATPARVVSQELREEALKLRRTLLLDLQALVTREVVPESDLNLVTRGQSSRDVAQDLGILAAIIRDGWPRMVGKTAIKLHDVHNAARLSTALFAELSERRQQSTPQKQAASQRRRAFTLLMRSYDEARDEVAYLRRKEGDENLFAPSLYAGRRR